LYPNGSNAEVTQSNRISLTPTGFKINTTSSNFNTSGDTYIYLCIRRPDGYVGKPVELGTGVFAMDTGASSSTIPNYTSGFPVDLSFRKNKTGTSFWQTSARLIQGKAVWLNSTNAEGSSSGEMFDSNVGYGADNNGSNFQNFMFKRHAGFDVVTWKGDGVAGRYITHTGLGKTPEMIWLKRRSGSQDWIVYHKGLNGGSNPGEYELHLNNSNAEDRASNFYDTDPTATTFRVDSGQATNYDGQTYIAMLFASVSGISSVGFYDGSSSAQTITTGFQPRFLILKNVSSGGDWYVLDTTRGWGSGNDEYLILSGTQAQASHDIGAPTSTGFTLTNNDEWNNASKKYIYYAHS